MRKFFIVVCLFSVLGLGFCVEIDGSVKAATATPISQGVYEDARIAKYDYKYYTINVPKPSKVVMKFRLEPGSHSQALEYEFKASTIRSEAVYKNYFVGKSKNEVRFEDSFSVDVPGDYILKIGKYSNWFLGEYVFEISFTCQDRDDVSGLVCVGGEWVNKTPAPKQVAVSDLNFSKEVIDDVCEGCFGDGVCYDLGTLFNDSFCSKDGAVLSFLKKGDGCSFDYECASGECKKDKCYEPGLWDKIVAFLKELF